MNKLKTLLFVLAFVFSSFAFAAGEVNINTADRDALMQAIDGIGEKRADAIIAYREANGPFKSVDELLNVKGVGAATLDKNRELLTVGEQ